MEHPPKSILHGLRAPSKTHNTASPECPPFQRFQRVSHQRHFYIGLGCSKRPVGGWGRSVDCPKLAKESPSLKSRLRIRPSTPSELQKHAPSKGQDLGGPPWRRRRSDCEMGTLWLAAKGASMEFDNTLAMKIIDDLFKARKKA